MNSLDPFMPLAAGTYHIQLTPESRWLPVPAERLANMLQRDNPPTLRTVLAISSGDVEQPETLHYNGEFYADFDGETIDEAIEGVQRFCGKLEETGLDLNTARFFATGGRGFHLELPALCFIDDMPPEGLPLLPLIYKEMALTLYVDTLDLRVYSCRKGRMWRCPNVRRDNDRYKVPVTPAEIVAMTPDLYADLTSTKRPFPPLAAPVLVPELAKLFDQCRAKVETKVTKRKVQTRVDEAFRNRFGGKLPPVLAAMGQGRFPSPVGWNLVVFQLGLVAHAVDLDEGALIDACRGLIASHKSDGHRYNTAHRREAEMRRMFAHLADSDYQLSVGGIRSILPKGLRCNDFKGLPC